MPENPLLTPEDKVALAILKKIPHVKAEERDAWADIYKTGLRRWQRELAEWCAAQPIAPSRKEMAAVATQLSGTKVTYNMMRSITVKPEFVDLLTRATNTAQGEARVKFENDLPFYVEKHREGLEKAVAAENYVAYKHFTVPALERLWPRGDHAAQQNLQVNVTLNARQLAREDAPEIEVTATPIVLEKDDGAI